MEQLTTTDGQVVMQAVQGVTPQQVQVMQMNAAGQVIQGANGQQIMVHAMPQNGQIQVGTGAQGLQQIQVVPVSSLQTTNGQGQILLQQPQQTQIVQTADGQTFIYQPVAIENTALQAPQATGFNDSNNLQSSLYYICSDQHQWKFGAIIECNPSYYKCCGDSTYSNITDDSNRCSSSNIGNSST